MHDVPKFNCNWDNSPYRHYLERHRVCFGFECFSYTNRNCGAKHQYYVRNTEDLRRHSLCPHYFNRRGSYYLEYKDYGYS